MEGTHYQIHGSSGEKRRVSDLKWIQDNFENLYQRYVINKTDSATSNPPILRFSPPCSKPMLDAFKHCFLLGCRAPTSSGGRALASVTAIHHPADADKGHQSCQTSSDHHLFDNTENVELLKNERAPPPDDLSIPLQRPSPYVSPRYEPAPMCSPVSQPLTPISFDHLPNTHNKNQYTNADRCSSVDSRTQTPMFAETKPTSAPPPANRSNPHDAGSDRSYQPDPSLDEMSIHAQKSTFSDPSEASILSIPSAPLTRRRKDALSKPYPTDVIRRRLMSLEELDSPAAVPTTFFCIVKKHPRQELRDTELGASRERTDGRITGTSWSRLEERLNAGNRPKEVPRAPAVMLSVDQVKKLIFPTIQTLIESRIIYHHDILYDEEGFLEDVTVSPNMELIGVKKTFLSIDDLILNTTRNTMQFREAHVSNGSMGIVNLSKKASNGPVLTFHPQRRPLWTTLQAYYHLKLSPVFLRRCIAAAAFANSKKKAQGSSSDSKDAPTSPTQTASQAVDARQRMGDWAPTPSGQEEPSRKKKRVNKYMSSLKVLPMVGPRSKQRSKG
ncbi:uncharacterized protein LOC126311223 [Schistocerca gregaria]|uniref:uncharacterized protein LOC126311223 n=1 Tax=Schistocerca gregaria TaxID=7010 RepID=UPI00211E7E93|nr:uncharacterized protein LOC126311223 [Schistocerca gregaria]XP_049848142.1 uncharacterized protein LOC126311223 [Schistocerca gregaria]